MAQTARSLIKNPESTFKEAWEGTQIPAVRQVKGNSLTPAYNKGALYKRLRADAEEAQNIPNDPMGGKTFRGMATKGLHQAAHAEGPDKEAFATEQKAIIDAGVAENATPLVFDPDVLQLLKENAPFAFDRLTRRGQEGYQVVFNNVSERESPRGYGTESDTANLQDDARDLSFETVKVDLAKYMDSATVTDFSAEASAHYMDLSELAIGARMAEYAQLHEQTVLYGDPTLATNAASDGETGGPGDPNAFKGLANLYTEDSTAITSNVTEGIKAQIRELLQGDYAVNPADLEVWMSWSLFDEIENELTTDAGARFAIDVDNINLNYGDYEVNIGGVPVVPGHNIDQHTYNDPGGTDYTVGDRNDVFIVNTATAEYRELLPMTTIPLAQRGAADEVGMVEFGTLIERSASDDGSGSMTANSAEFGRYLSGVDVVSSS